MSSKLETAANIAILVSAVLFSIVAYRYLVPAAPGAPREAPIYSPGDSVGALGGIELGDHDKTVIFFLSSTCRYCTESMPFYREVAERAQAQLETGRTLQLVVVGRESESTLQSYANTHGFHPHRFVTVTQEGAPKLALTPTLVLAGRDGTVEAAWIGQLDLTNQQQFFRLLETAQPGG